MSSMLETYKITCPAYKWHIILYMKWGMLNRVLNINYIALASDPFLGPCHWPVLANDSNGCVLLKRMPKRPCLPIGISSKSCHSHVSECFEWLHNYPLNSRISPNSRIYLRSHENDKYNYTYIYRERERWMSNILYPIWQHIHKGSFLTPSHSMLPTGPSADGSSM